METTIQLSRKTLQQAVTRYMPDAHVLTDSVQILQDVVFGLAQTPSSRLFVGFAAQSALIPDNLVGSITEFNDGVLFTGELNADNARALREMYPWTAPVLLGNANSFGFGDRLGNASVPHLSALENSEFRPILAQQSIREMDRTQRSAQQVMDCATWAVFEAGYTKGFGSDADHLKTTADIDRTMAAGFTMYTIDPSDYVDNRVNEMDISALELAFGELPWNELLDTPQDFRNRYVNRAFDLGHGITLQPGEEDILRAAVKYGRVVLHTYTMFNYLRSRYADRPSEVELSVDETPHPTTPEEHLIIAAELQRLNVELVSLAPRFCGDFEKGVDFKGDLQAFKDEYLLHQAISGTYGNYKISVHSGSDKFQVYAAIGELKVGTVHVKTAGTSYLEALRAISMTNTPLFREIITFAGERFETDKKTYHISATLDGYPAQSDLSDDALPGLLNDDNARQIFHVTFGSVLTSISETGERVYYPRFMQTLRDHSDVYHQCLYTHFRKHLAPFE
jgi:tagaturonate epimerase